MKLYLAAMYQWMPLMKVARDQFRAEGFEVTAQWIESDAANQARSRHDNATLDLQGIDEAEGLVLYTLKLGTMFSSGGRMVELGYALARGKWVVIVGDRENVFCHLDYICVVESTEAAIEVLKNLRNLIPVKH